MKKLLFKILIFSTPILIFLLPPMILLKISGENYTPIDDLIVENKKFLIGYLYNEDNYKYLKWKTLVVKPKYDVIALGSSRVLQFRENMFKNSFYNAGYTVTSISDFVPFLKSIPKEKYPKVLIIALDQWMFNKNWDAIRSNPSKHSKFDNTYYSSPNLTTMKSVWKEIVNNEYNYTDLLDSKSPITKIGLNAKIKNSGFRKDGSMLYGNQIYKLINKDTSAKDFNFSNTFLRIKNGGARFQYGKSVNNKALLELQNTMSFCKANNIYVVAFLPPFANKVNEKMNENGNYPYMKTIYELAKPIIKKNGFEIWDFTNLKKIDSNDNETLDGLHGGEVCYLKMLIYMIENESILKNNTDLEKLKKDLRHKANNYSVYSN